MATQEEILNVMSDPYIPIIERIDRLVLELGEIRRELELALEPRPVPWREVLPIDLEVGWVMRHPTGSAIEGKVVGVPEPGHDVHGGCCTVEVEMEKGGRMAWMVPHDKLVIARPYDPITGV